MTRFYQGSRPQGYQQIRQWYGEWFPCGWVPIALAKKYGTLIISSGRKHKEHKYGRGANESEITMLLRRDDES